MKIVLDANVLVSGLVIGSAAPAQIISLWKEDRFDIAVSEHILDGASRALNKSYWRKRLDIRVIELRLADVRARMELAEFVSPAEGIYGVAEDDEDDLVLATAVAARADYLVTGDNYLLRIGQFRGIPIVSPRAFLDLVTEML